MKIKRIVANIHAPKVDAAERFYRDGLGLEKLMDHGRIVICGSADLATIQVANSPTKPGEIHRDP